MIRIWNDQKHSSRRGEILIWDRLEVWSNRHITEYDVFLDHLA